MLENTDIDLLSESNALQSTEDNDLTKCSSSVHKEVDSTLVKPPNKQQQDLLSYDSTGIRDFSPDENEYLPTNDKIRKRRLSPSPKKKGKKRTKNEETWKKNVNKKNKKHREVICVSSRKDC